MNFHEAQETLVDPRKYQLQDPEDGRQLLFTGFEDTNWHIHCFKEDMRDKGFESTVNDDDDLVPRKPFGAYGRRNADPAYPGPPHPEDEDRISKYTSAIGRHNKSNACVVGCFLATCDPTVCQELDTHVHNLRAKTRENFHEICRVLMLLYGQWTSFKGNQNWTAMQEIAMFMDRKSVIDGLRRLTRLRRERDGWTGLMAGSQLYDDTFYRPWLLQRMRNWVKLDWYANSFQSQPLLTFDAMKGQLLAHVKRMHEEDMYLGVTTRPTLANPRHIADSTAYSYESTNAAHQQLTGQLHEVSEQLRAISTVSNRPTVAPVKDMSRVVCYNCERTGHISRDCQEVRKKPNKYGNAAQQYNNRQPRVQIPSYRPHPEAAAQVGNKRAFDPRPTSAIQLAAKRPYVSDPSKAKWPQQGTGRSPRAHVATHEQSYSDEDSTLAAYHAQMMIDQQEEDETLDEGDGEY